MQHQDSTTEVRNKYGVKGSLLFSFMLHNLKRAAANKGVIKASQEMV